MTAKQFFHHWRCSQTACPHKRKMVTGLIWLLIVTIVTVAVVCG